MVTRQEREGNSKYQTEVLDAMLAEKGNKQCADCGAKGPRWASTNLGCFLCIRCSGIHRNMGTHISKVRSVTLDKWSKEQVDFFKELGNKRVNKYYEARMPDDYQRPKGSDDYGMEKFIRDKYEKKRWAAKTTHDRSPRRGEGEGDRSPRPSEKEDGERVVHQPPQQAQQPQQPLLGFQPTIAAPPAATAAPQSGQQQFPSALFSSVPASGGSSSPSLHDLNQPSLSKDTLLSLYATPMQPQNNQQMQQQRALGATGYHQQPNYYVHLPTAPAAQQQYYVQPQFQQQQFAQQPQYMQQQQQQQYSAQAPQGGFYGRPL